MSAVTKIKNNLLLTEGQPIMDWLREEWEEGERETVVEFHGHFFGVVTDFLRVDSYPIEPTEYTKAQLVEMGVNL